MTNIVIVEDDQLFSRKLYTYLKQEFRNDVIDIINYDYNNLFSRHYKLCFIDIELGMFNGIEIARRYQNIEENAIIVFISNYDDFIYSAQIIKMFYFIRKSYFEEDFKQFISKYAIEINNNNKVFEVLSNGNKVFITLQSVLYVEVVKNNCYIVTKDKEYKIRSTLKALYQEIESDSFCQINQHEIVNLKYVRTIVGKEILLENNLKFQISKRQMQQVIHKFYNYNIMFL